jgi:glycosyltransferase involved in cell wall biosynthesis
MDELASKFSEFGEVLRANYINTYDRRLRSFSDVFPGSLTHCRKQWEDFQPTLIHLNKQNLEDGLDLLNLAESLPYPRAVTIHITQTQASLGAFLGRGRDWIAGRFLRQFNGALIAISKTRGKKLRQFIGSAQKNSQIETIENGVWVPTREERLTKRKEARSQLGVEPNQLLIVAIGRMEQQKRPLLFLEWAKYLRSLLPSVRFLWVGDGRSTSDWEHWVQQNQAEAYIQRLGWQTDVTPYLAAADGFFHPAQFEGLPFALLEAMAWSLPCFITPSLAKELSFPEGVCAIVGEEGDYSNLRNLVEPRQRSSIGEKGYQLVQQKFSLAKMVERYEALYSHVLSNSQQSKQR